MARDGGHLNPPCDSSVTVLVGTQDHAIPANLSVSELFGQVQAEVPRPALIRGALRLVRGGGDVDLKTHLFGLLGMELL